MNKLKSFIPKSLLALLAAGFGFAGCSSDPEVPITPSITVTYNGETNTSATLNEIPKEGDSETFTLTASRSWVITTGINSGWVSISRTSGEAGTFEITVTAEANTTIPRSATLTLGLVNSSTTATVSVLQEGDEAYLIANSTRIADFRAAYEPILAGVGGVNAASTLSDEVTFYAVIVSNSTTGAPLSQYYIAVQDAVNGMTTAKSGVVIAFDSTGLNAGDKVLVTCNAGNKVNYYNGLMQVTASSLTVMSTGNQVTPITITQDQLLDYESQLVQIENVQIESTTATTWSGSKSFQVNDGATFTSYVRSGATFSGETIPTGSGTLVGIAGIYKTSSVTTPQLQPRSPEDYAGLTGDRFTIPDGSETATSMSIATFRSTYDTGSSSTTTEGIKLTGVIVSHYGTGTSSANNQTFILQDAQTAHSGLAVKLSGYYDTATYGDEVVVYLAQGSAVSYYNGMLQAAATSIKEVVSSNNTVTPISISIAQMADYESQVVQLDNVQVFSTTAATWSGSHDFVDTNNAVITAYVRTAATDFNTTTIPTGSGPLIGISGIFTPTIQIQPRFEADYAGLTGPRFAFDYLNLTPSTTSNIAAAGGTATITVSASSTLSWSANVSDSSVATIDTSSGTGDGTITVTFSANTSTTDTRTTTITVTDGASLTKSVTFTQSKASVAGATTYSLVTDGNFAAGEYLFVGKEGDSYFTLNTYSSNYISTTDISSFYGSGIFTDDTSETLKGRLITATEITAGQYTLQYAYANDYYLYATSSSANNMNYRASNTDGNSVWAVTMVDNSGTYTGQATIEATGDKTRNSMRFNYNNGTNMRFSCYATTSGVSKIYIYKKTN